MNENKEELKVSIYDKFKCIADKCNFTCCEGWDINVDKDTYNKWKVKFEDKKDILDNIKVEKCHGEETYFINKDTEEVCPLLDGKGLCSIVKEYGEEYLSLTCHKFPRIENEFEGNLELSLSCACPEVVDILDNFKEKIIIASEDTSRVEPCTLEGSIRDTLINIMENHELSIDKKFIISYEILLNILKNKDSNEDDLLEEVHKCNDSNYIKELMQAYEHMDMNEEESIEEFNELFLDIIENYREVPGLEEHLENIFDFAEEADLDRFAKQWKNFKVLFEKYNPLIKKCIISKILSSCAHEELEKLTIAYELIILEYLLVRYALFLNYLMDNEEVKESYIKDYIVIFTRIIGNNSSTVREFIEEGFGNELLEVGYLCFISLF